ncbi:MAG TPA: hypothetical protein VK177_00785 [Flavobacteriales bacterium]|nr:hypothetical protein [Flavobacteriales bacterium]
MAILKKIENNELYLYMNGNLIYKRWLKTGESKIFDVMAYDKYMAVWSQTNNNNGLLVVKAKLKLLSTEEGGRKTPFKTGYRPNHVFEYFDSKFKESWIGDVVLDTELMYPGEERIVTIRFLADSPIEKYMNIGRKWWIHEVHHRIGEAEIVSIEKIGQ